jgi:ribosomal protein L11 methylase PrmA
LATRPPSGWTAVVLEAPFPLEDEALGALAEGSLGLAVTDAPAGGSRVAVYFESPADARELLLRIPRRVGESCRAHLEAVEDQRWVERYQAGLVPFSIGTRFVVMPQEGLTKSGRIRFFRSGQAFGTGGTDERLCRGARAFQSIGALLDLGTGTVLALVAAHCGAGASRPAIPTPTRCGSRPRSRRRAAWRAGRVTAGSTEISPRGVRRRRPRTSAGPSSRAQSDRRGPRRWIPARGQLLATETAEVSGELARAGLRVEECRTSGEWALLVARRGEG